MAMEVDIDKSAEPPLTAGPELSLAHERRYGVRAVTLSNIRWVAIAGQLLTVLIVHFGLGFNLMLVPSLAVILVSIWFNIIATTFLPANARLSERVALGWLLFDAAGMATLLALSGGCSNDRSGRSVSCSFGATLRRGGCAARDLSRRFWNCSPRRGCFHRRICWSDRRRNIPDVTGFVGDPACPVTRTSIVFARRNG